MIKSFRDRETKTIFEGEEADAKKGEASPKAASDESLEEGSGEAGPDAEDVEIVDYHQGDRMSYRGEETKRPPTHPGYVVRIELEELGMSVTEAAERLGVARPTLSQLVNEKKRVSPEMALRLGRFFDNGTEIWMSMQARYDQWEVENDPDSLREAERIEPVTA